MFLGLGSINLDRNFWTGMIVISIIDITPRMEEL